MYRNAICSILLLFSIVFVSASVSIAQRSAGYSDSEEVQILQLVNRERNRRRLTALSWDDRLANLARNYSRKMARERFFSHVDSDGNDVVQRARFSRVRGWSKLGENLFMCSDTDQFVSMSVRGWMRSPSHRENILDPEWRTTGIGIAYARNGDIYITEVFAD